MHAGSLQYMRHSYVVTLARGKSNTFIYRAHFKKTNVEEASADNTVDLKFFKPESNIIPRFLTCKFTFDVRSQIVFIMEVEKSADQRLGPQVCSGLAVENISHSQCCSARS